jgi:glycosyltransferase involved in cell wall biosynthesis
MIVETSPGLVTVVITCYNHGIFLPDAIDSVLRQDYPFIEIVVVDDGSIDNTKDVTARYQSVKYVYQTNQGLSAARNTGVDSSSGEFILFLDADDWLLPGAISTNYNYLKNEPEIAFVSGAFKVVQPGRKEIIMQAKVETHHYRRLLEFNYIAMHATVLYRRWVFEQVRYDTSLKACEDYDLYLQVARKHPILHHTQFIAVYRFHESNMSHNTIMMMNAAINTVKRQQRHLVDDEERRSLKKGIKNWKMFYLKRIYSKYLLPHQNTPSKKQEMWTLWVHSKRLYFRFYLKKIFHVIQRVYKKSYSGVSVTWFT